MHSRFHSPTLPGHHPSFGTACSLFHSPLALLDTLTHTLSTTALDDATLTKDLLDCELLEHEVARLEAQRLALRTETRARYTRAVLEALSCR